MNPLTAFLIFVSVALAQTDPATAPVPRYDVASIKPAAPGGHGMYIRPTAGGRTTATNMTLKSLIELAYHIQPFQISGGPSWMEALHYDIEAKPDSPAKQSDWPVMLQGLLADRSS